MFMFTDRAEAGMPHVPTSVYVRDAPAARAGAPKAPAGLRVSATRHGARGKNRVCGRLCAARRVEKRSVSRKVRLGQCFILYSPRYSRTLMDFLGARAC